MKQSFEHYRTLRKEMDAWLDQSRRMDRRAGMAEAKTKRTIRWPGSPTISSPEMTGCESTLNTCAICSPDGWNGTACTVMNPKPKPITDRTFLLFLPRYLGLFPEDEKANALLARRCRTHRQLGRGHPRMV